ncbi:MAG: Molybdenum cofactor biosynthesis protein A [candidate division Zixibacteria bacterium RBG-1]|nr:MAG: Molybdenum cofactor biosynthesis protein A [candidate division Zixibacteria bacterium RBG-1]
MKNLIDKYGRKIEYLRISVTDRCNLSCLYCIPPEGIKLVPKEKLLTFEEILRVAKITVGLGVQKIKLTGGEPLVRKGIVELIRKLSEIPELEDLSLTTNGILLSSLSEKLFQAGLKRVNVSVDSLQPDRFREITGGGELSKVLLGIDKAQNLGMKVKVNTVSLRGFNDPEILDFVQFSQIKKLEVRFIEFMPLCGNGWNQKLFIPLNEAKEIIAKSYTLKLTDGNGVATVYEIENGGRIGFIPTLSEPFCSGCSRIRLTSWGGIRPCLFSNIEYRILPLLRDGSPDEKIAEVIIKAVQSKPEYNPYLAQKTETKEILMRNVGG